MNRSRRRGATLAGAIAAAILLVATVSAFAQPAPGDYTDDTALPAGRRGERIRQVPTPSAPATGLASRPS